MLPLREVYSSLIVFYLFVESRSEIYLCLFTYRLSSAVECLYRYEIARRMRNLEKHSLAVFSLSRYSCQSKTAQFYLYKLLLFITAWNRFIKSVITTTCALELGRNYTEISYAKTCEFSMNEIREWMGICTWVRPEWMASYN